MTTRRPRGLMISEGERALWDQVTRDVEPLRRRKRRPAAKAADPEAPPPEVDAARATRAAPIIAAKRAAKIDPKFDAKSPPPLAPIDRRVRRALARGGAEVDARIDLHGLTQQAAHAKLVRFLLRAQADGARLVLVITGKGGPGGANVSGEMWGHTRGVLRRQVPLWLQMPDLRAVVVGFETANIGHGGEGALYVRVRRRRQPADPL